ncbi:substrate-binding periplasmic protein [Aquipseudomonas ullengensis]|uniref:Transporter substrate-binding domain-containing protein n=1 Tax=Aquipseudomonas ullengensis TaxID=2759166 RepID=A0A7W4LN78_9GAMM|nr:transporter substrate-binding domain-containing protein [Pseudomonas ullengensis]MBB2496264.1 transporter substrate-binding domain-containing protein [Pseudomonas ullengensis]
MRRLLPLFALLCCLPLQAGELLTYPRHSEGENPEAYVVELLRQALDKSGAGHRLQASDKPMPQSRAQLSLEQNDGHLQVMWTMTTREREQNLLPVRIPIYKGLIGWRVALVREEDRDWLASVRNLAQLKPMRIGQRADWPDTHILRSNGLQVITSQSYDSLFRMLDAGRFDLFPREVVVAHDEQQRASAAGLKLVVDSHIVLHYPSAFYFFTSRARADLAADLQRGLEAMIADGSFDRLFEQYHGEHLRKARLDQRQVIELQNPDLPEQTPFERSELWYRPSAPK